MKCGWDKVLLIIKKVKWFKGSYLNLCVKGENTSESLICFFHISVFVPGAQTGNCPISTRLHHFDCFLRHVLVIWRKELFTSKAMILFFDYWSMSLTGKKEINVYENLLEALHNNILWRKTISASWIFIATNWSITLFQNRVNVPENSLK